jgi:hypothetical protein
VKHGEALLSNKLNSTRVEEKHAPVKVEELPLKIGTHQKSIFKGHLNGAGVKSFHFF